MSFSPNYIPLVSQHSLPDGAVEGGFEGVANGVGDAGEAQVVGDGPDDVFSVVGGSFSHDGCESVSQGFEGVVVHCGGQGSQKVAIGFEDASPDGGS